MSLEEIKHYLKVIKETNKYDAVIFNPSFILTKENIFDLDKDYTVFEYSISSTVSATNKRVLGIAFDYPKTTRTIFIDEYLDKKIKDCWS